MAARQVINGRYAEASVGGGVVIALLFDWSVKFKSDHIDATGHGDLWRKHLPTVTEWEFKAKSFVVPASANHYGRLWSAGSTLTLLTINGYDGKVTTGTPIFTGQGFPQSFELLAPMGVATQEFVVLGYGAPTLGVAA
jgi:hypothetical protein